MVRISVFNLRFLQHFRGKSVKPAVVAADGESANPGELVLFTTNGAGWKHIGEWKKAS